MKITQMFITAIMALLSWLALSVMANSDNIARLQTSDGYHTELLQEIRKDIKQILKDN